MKRDKKLTALALSILILMGLGAGCAKGVTEDAEIDIVTDIGYVEMPLGIVPLNGAMFEIKMPSAAGTLVKQNQKALIDYSNTVDGYVMVKYLQKTTKELRVQIKGPSGVAYTYTLKSNGDYEVYPFSDGNGAYTVGVFEQIEGTKYSTANSLNVTVSLNDEFAPFLRPNQYVNFTKESKAVAKAAELVKDTNDLTGKISKIYNYVIANLSYDKELAANVKPGYLPDIDVVLEKGKGICFDYSAVMTAMLRSLGIPTKLVVGYAGTAYHAWINVYSEKDGWINGIIFFDGESWKLMDPTFASSAKQSAEVMRYIGDGENYSVRFLY